MTIDLLGLWVVLKFFYGADKEIGFIVFRAMVNFWGAQSNHLFIAPFCTDVREDITLKHFSIYIIMGEVSPAAVFSVNHT